ncbi:T9SS type A sorting domain-containing protein [Flavobacteriales bacterium]|nr:T9SS type A sorting domain-containing protein [Flavobacteriales bacterium]
MKKILLSIMALGAYCTVSAQYHFFFEANGANPGGLNTEATEYPVGGGMGAGWAPVLGTTNALPTASASQTIPFAFNFNGGAVTTYTAMSNASISFAASPSAPSTYATVTMPSATLPDSSVNIMGIQGSGASDNIVSKTFGTAPNRQHWIHFASYTPSTLTGWTYWAIVLEETTNNIFVVDMRANAVYTGITVGIQVNSTTAYVTGAHSTLASNDPSPTDNRYYEFIPGVQPLTDMAAKTSTLAPIQVLSTGPFTIAGTIQNRGSATVTSYDLNYKVGAGAVVTSAITGASIANGATGNFSHPTTWAPATSGNYSIEAWATNINGNTDLNTANDKVTFSISVVDTVVPRKPLLEVFTSSTCGPCVAGNQNMDNVVLPAITDYTVIKYQQNFPGAGDPYFTTESVNRRGFYGVNSIPRMEIDGEWDQNAASFTAAIFNSYKAEPAFIGINITSARFAGPQVRVEGVITPYATLSGNLRYHVVINEKKTTQNVGSNGETEFFEVMMDMIPDENGNVLTSLNNGVVTNFSTFSNMSTSNVEEFSDLKAVVFVQDMTTGKVMQSEWMDVTASPASIDENATNATLNVFPNPSNGLVNLEYISAETANVTVTVMNTLGAVVYNANMAHNNSTMKSFDFSHLTKGVYLVNVSSDKGTVTKKMIIQ